MDWSIYIPMLLSGLKWAVVITVIALVVGYPLGLGLGVGVTRKNPIIKWVCLAVVEVGRGAPALVILYFFYYGLPTFGVSMNPFPAACVALAWNASAYASEMWRAGLQSVPKGQLEAAAALGVHSRSSFWKVQLPQGARSCTPALMGLAIQMFQATSLAYAITVPEVMKQATTIGAETFKYMPTFLAAALCYAVIALPATWLTNYFEKRMAVRY